MRVPLCKLFVATSSVVNLCLCEMTKRKHSCRLWTDALQGFVVLIGIKLPQGRSEIRAKQDN